MVREIVEIDRDRCTGCGLCARACHEGAIGMVDGKAMLLRDDYCDGMGDCLPECPAGAIRITKRESAAGALELRQATILRNGASSNDCLRITTISSKVFARLARAF